MNQLDLQYLTLLRKIKERGYKKQTRNGAVRSLFGYQITHDMRTGFPLLTTKRMHFKSIVEELLWFLSGSSDLRDLLKKDVHIWTGDAHANYIRGTGNNMNKKEFEKLVMEDEKFGNVWGDLGKIYGVQWRNWGGVDQIKNVIDTLKTNPDDRRMIVSAWNVDEIDSAVLPPCHYSFQFFTRELTIKERYHYWYFNIAKNKSQYDQRMEPTIEDSWDLDGGWVNMILENLEKEYIGELNKENVPTRAISLLWNQRSVDFVLGLPFNIASYGLLLYIIAKKVNMIPDELIGNLGDTHIYQNQMEAVNKQLEQTPHPLPKLKIRDKQINDISEYTFEDFELIDYKHGPKIKAPLSN